MGTHPGAQHSVLPVSKVTTNTNTNIPVMLQIPLGQSGELKQVVCWEFEGTAFDQGNEAASWFTKYLESPHRLVRYAGHASCLQMLRICPCCKSEGQLQLSLYHTGGESKSSIQSDSARRPTDPKWTTDQEVAFADGFPALLVSLVSRFDHHCVPSCMKILV